MHNKIRTMIDPHYKSEKKRVGQKRDEKVTSDYKYKDVIFLVKTLRVSK